MSIEAIAHVLTLDVGDPLRKLVLVGLANHAHRDGTGAWATNATITEYANCTTRTVQRHLRILEAEGFIRRGDQTVIPTRIPANHRPVVYDVALNDETRQSWGVTGDTPSDPRDDIETVLGVTNDLPRGDTAASNKPTTEPTTKPTSCADEPKPRRATTVPDLFPVTDRMRNWAREKRLHIDIATETEQWRDWHQAKGDTAKDWVASWRVWMRKADRYGSERNGRPRPRENADGLVSPWEA